MQALDIVTVAKAAEIIGVDQSLVRRWIRQRRLPAILHGARSYAVAKVAVDEIAQMPRKRGNSIELPETILKKSKKILGIA